MFILKANKKKKKLLKLYVEKHRLENFCEENDTDEARECVDEIIKQIDDFIEKDFAKMIFEHYSRKKPILYERSSNKKVKWNEVFESEFENVSKSLRHSLVGLVMDEGRYRL